MYPNLLGDSYKIIQQFIQVAAAEDRNRFAWLKLQLTKESLFYANVFFSLSNSRSELYSFIYIRVQWRAPLVQNSFTSEPIFYFFLKKSSVPKFIIWFLSKIENKEL